MLRTLIPTPGTHIATKNFRILKFWSPTTLSFTIFSSFIIDVHRYAFDGGGGGRGHNSNLRFIGIRIIASPLAKLSRQKLLHWNTNQHREERRPSQGKNTACSKNHSNILDTIWKLSHNPWGESIKLLKIFLPIKVESLGGRCQINKNKNQKANTIR